MYTIDVQREGMPVLRLIRSFTLPRQPRSIGRHDLNSSLQVKNLSGEAHRVIVAYQGGVRIPQANPGTDDRVISLGLYDGVRVAGSYRSCAEAAKSGSIPLYSVAKVESNIRLSWAGTGNTYFTCTIAPLSRSGDDAAGYIADVSAVDLDGSPETQDDVTLRFVTAAETVAPGGELQYPAFLYVGEKDGDAFRAVPEYKARNFYFQVVQSYGSCTFTWLVELMVWLLNRLVWVVRDYGLAIIILVLLVRVLLHPITKKGQVNMVRMQQKMGEFAPKVEELKRKFANDKARLQQETMKLYREHGINPASNMLGCLPMVIQMPIWVALWISLSNNIHMRHQGFLYPLTWIQDLTAPDALYTFSSAIVVPLMGWQLPSFNLLPILLAIFMYLQQKYQPKPKPNPNMTDQQRQQQEMMQMMMPMMSIMMLLIFYKAPSGLSLYVMSSSIFGILEQKRIRKHLEEEQRGGGAGPVSPARPPGVGEGSAPRRHSWLERLQKMADDAGKVHSQRAVKGKPRR
jgi:YidC/Oxa1 family membrane protein insertase